MRRVAFLLAAYGMISGALTLSAVADEKIVNATVTPKVISVSVSTASLSYGTVAIGTNDNLPTTPSVAVTNTGNVEADFKIKGANSTPGNWTLSSTTGIDTYRHEFDLSSGGSFTALSTSNLALANDVQALIGSVDAFFRLDMPTSTTVFGQQTLPITITALESLSPGPS